MLWRYSRRDTKVLLLATLLVFSGYGLLLGQSWRTELRTNPSQVTANTVGVVAGVPENEVNTYAAALDERARTLDAREDAIMRASEASSTLRYVTFGGLGLFGLILLNFYLDHKRRMSLGV
jgi:hypothetical protein